MTPLGGEEGAVERQVMAVLGGMTAQRVSSIHKDFCYNNELAIRPDRTAVRCYEHIFDIRMSYVPSTKFDWPWLLRISTPCK